MRYFFGSYAVSSASIGPAGNGVVGIPDYKTPRDIEDKFLDMFKQDRRVTGMGPISITLLFYQEITKEEFDAWKVQS